MSDPKDQMCYVGFAACGCAVAATVDIPNHAKENARFVADLIRDGLTVERRTVEWCRENLLRCTHKKAPAVAQGTLVL